MLGYYEDKVDILKDLFGNGNIDLRDDRLVVDGKNYAIIDDVIILLEPDEYPATLKKRIGLATDATSKKKPQSPFADDVQFSFGAEWRRFNEIKPEYEKVFNEYFDLVDLETLNGKRVCDLGCGMGRWSYFLNKKCLPREGILVDFSEAIFFARNNLRAVSNAFFFMADIKKLPFRENFADFIFSLGVLHHLPTNGLDEVRKLKKMGPRILVYLYYSLDNRPFYFRWLLYVVNIIRLGVSRIRNRFFRSLFSLLAAACIYAPMVWIGRIVKPLRLSNYVPLYGEHHYMNFRWWRLLAYDRFFTPVEQRFSRREIMGLKDSFSEVIISKRPAYWHFLCIE